MVDLVPSSQRSAVDSHDYEDPAEVRKTVDQLVAETKEKISLLPNTSEEDTSSQALSPDSSNKTKFPKIFDNSTSYNKNKQTTDSGFYSVKGVNSDSDSGCENTGRDAADMLDSGYATLNSARDHNSSNLSGVLPSSTKGNRSKDNYHLSFSKSVSSHLTSSSSHSLMSSSTSGYHPSSVSSDNSNCTLKGDQGLCLTTGSQNLDTGHYDSLVQKKSVKEEEDSPDSMNNLMSPIGDEYSIVLKRGKSRSLAATNPQEQSSTQTHKKLTQSLHINTEAVHESVFIDGTKTPPKRNSSLNPRLNQSDINERQNLKVIDLNSSLDSDKIGESPKSGASISSKLELGATPCLSSGNSSEVDIPYSAGPPMALSRKLSLESYDNVPPPLPTTPIPVILTNSPFTKTLKPVEATEPRTPSRSSTGLSSVSSATSDITSPSSGDNFSFSSEYSI